MVSDKREDNKQWNKNNKEYIVVITTVKGISGCLLLHRFNAVMRGEDNMKIGNIEIKGKACLAPMAGTADRAFRELCRGYGAAFCVSEMVSSKGIAFNSKKSAELMNISPAERPCGVQIFGDEPSTMAEAALFAMRYAPEFIDINMGCPAPKISGNGSGSALMKKPELCGEIVSAVSKAVDVPVTVKIRKGWDDKSVNAVEVAKICEAAGAAAITVHGRTREQFYQPPADWDIIAKVKNAVSIPVIGNGDVTSAQEADRMIVETNCDMVMVGRAALGNPWIFREINAYFDTDKLIPPPGSAEKISVMLKHIQKLIEYKGEYIGMREARKHVAWYIKGFKGAAEFRNKAGRLTTFDELVELSKQIYAAQL